jgi:release factor glutamine methyltransferase
MTEDPTRENGGEAERETERQSNIPTRAPDLLPEPLTWAIHTLAAAGIESPRLEAQLLLAHLLQIGRTAVAAGLHAPLTPLQRRQYAHLVRERARHVPSAYLRGTQEFYGLDFAVDPSVLIPRPETELLVDWARERNAQRQAAEGTLLVDVGAGSGCIAVAFLAYSLQACALACDISAAAIGLARRNARSNGVADRLRCLRSDLLEAVAPRSCDIIVSNPPYIPAAKVELLQPEVRDFEPRLALDGGPDGLVFHRRLIAGASRALKPGGWLGIEVAAGQAGAVRALLTEPDFRWITTRRDLAGIERIVCAQKTGSE